MHPLGRIVSTSALLLAAGIARAQGDTLLADSPGPDDFVLVGGGAPAPICVDPAEANAVRRAASDMADDLARVTGQKPSMLTTPGPGYREIVVVGVLGSDPLIDRLVAEGKIDVRGVAGQWESAVVETVRNPLPGVDNALIIAGSDRRGAIYAAYWISESIGVSPWYWWADVPPHRRSLVAIVAGAHKLAPPEVRYRGIFLNDEDWGLRVWASKTFDPQTGNIGPKTYARIFELILRLRGNVLWPAMHPGTRAFNFYAEDKALADDYGIVMSSSHAEPMLRDNVDEWARDGSGEYNYGSNPANVLRYWEERVKSNGRFEDIYTVGMRGIHDGPMEGGGTVEERAARLRQIIADQRDLLRRYVNPEVSQVPQQFCPYKEVLGIYEKSPSIIPSDVTLLWPDDDYGYIQHFSDDAEQSRPGGAGVYYHVSYWGRPYDYLWLCSTPPALIGEEMTKAIRRGATRICIVNVGDLKPAEWDIEFFLGLAWNSHSWNPSDGQHEFFRRLAQRDFGVAYAEQIAAMLDEYYRLNFQRKPEHMGIDAAVPLLAQPVFSVDSDGDEAQRRLDAFSALRRSADAIGQEIDREHADAYYELVLYPIRAAELMNRKWLGLDRFESLVRQGRAAAARCLSDAADAQAAIDLETNIYNNRVASGKWRGMMSDAPREQAVFSLPGKVAPPVPSGAILGVAVEDSPMFFRGDTPESPPKPLTLPAFTSRIPRTHFIDLFDVGRESIDWTIQADEKWIQLSSTSGRGDQRVTVSINWQEAPVRDHISGKIRISAAAQSVNIEVPVLNESISSRGSDAGFAEVDGHVVIRATHPSAHVSGDGLKWEAIQGLGYEGSAVAAASPAPPQSRVPQTSPDELDYRIWIDTPGEWRFVTRLLPTWPLAGHPGRFAVAFDSAPAEVSEASPYRDENDPHWQEDVLRNAAFARFTTHLSKGDHILKIRAIDPGIVIDAFMLESLGASTAGYLWPVETRVPGRAP
jgi:hypothetical protein